MSDAIANTDRTLWRDEDDSVFITQGGGLGINCGGHVIVKPLLAWHQQSATIARLEAERDEAERQRQTWVALHSTLEAENARHRELLRKSLVLLDSYQPFTADSFRAAIRSALAEAQPASTGGEG